MVSIALSLGFVPRDSSLSSMLQGPADLLRNIPVHGALGRTLTAFFSEPSAKKALTLLDDGRARPVNPTISHVCSEIPKKEVKLAFGCC